MLLFSKGDINAIIILLKDIVTFSSAFALQANQGKFAFYVVNVKQTVLNRILALLKFSLGKLPFKYLGSPFSLNNLKLLTTRS